MIVQAWSFLLRSLFQINFTMFFWSHWNCFKQNQLLAFLNISQIRSSVKAKPSSVRRILKRGGGQKLQKIWEEHRSEFEIVTLKFHPSFRPNSGEEHKKKKGLHSNFVPFFPKLRWRAKTKKKVFTQISSHFSPNSGDFEPKAWCPTCKGGWHASILLTFLCNYAILATQSGGHGPMAPP